MKTPVRIGFDGSFLAGVVMVGLALGLNNLQAATVTLQEGVNGYSGSSDSYIENGGYGDDANMNFGVTPTVILNSEQYNSG